MFPETKILHFFVGMACAAFASPLGIVAAALAPVALGFAKEMYLHFTGQGANAENFAWTIAGAATIVLWLRLMPVRL
jgi:hypothetical protein